MEYFSWYPLPVFTPTAENRRAVRKARELEANTSAQSCPKCKTCDREFCVQIGLISHLRSHLCDNWSCDLHQHRCKNIITPSQFSRHYFSVPPSNVPNFCLLKTTPFSNSLPFLQGFLICISFFFLSMRPCTARVLTLTCFMLRSVVNPTQLLFTFLRKR